jgi:hypothetical protein
MKLLLTLAFACGALLLGGCADTSLLTDEEYERVRGPGAHSPDPTRYVPQADPYRRGRY